MADLARQRLQYIVECYGDGILDDRAKTEDLIRKLCGEDRRRIELLVGALNTGFVPDLIGWRGRGDPSRFLPRVARALEQQLGATPDEALWTAGSWGVALGLLDESAADGLRVLAPASVRPGGPPPRAAAETSGFRWPASLPSLSGSRKSVNLIALIFGTALVLCCLLLPLYCVRRAVPKGAMPVASGENPLGPNAEKVFFALQRSWPAGQSMRFLQFVGGGRRLMVLEDGHSLLSWDPQTGAVADAFNDFEGSVLGVSQDGSKLAVADGGSAGVTITDVNTHSSSGTLDWGGGRYTPCTFSPDNRFLACAHGPRYRLALWDLTFMKLFLEGPSLEEAPAEPTLAFSPDGTTIAVARCEDGTPATFSYGVMSFKLLRRFEGHGGRGSLVCFNPDGSRIATAANDKTVRIWGTATGNPVCRIDLRADAIRVLFHPALPVIFTLDATSRLSAWDERDGTEIGRMEDTAASMAVSPDGKMLTTVNRLPRTRVNPETATVRVYSLSVAPLRR
jgi:hypothetical protein